MNPRAYPVKFEIYDHDEFGGSTGDVLAVVETQDEASASVDIKTAVNATGWVELSEVIRLALVSMRLDGDKETPR